MSIVSRYEQDLDGSWDQSGGTFTQPDINELPKGIGTVSMTFRSTCGDYNSGTFTASLQATTEGTTSSPPDGTSQWDVLGTVTRGANGATINKGGQGVGINLARYKFTRVVYSVSGSPAEDAVLACRLLGDYVS